MTKVELTPQARRISIYSLVALFFMVLGSVGLDQVSKVHAEDKLMRWSHEEDLSQYQGQRYPLWSTGSPFPQETSDLYLALSLNYVRNMGAAWGALSGLPDNIRVPFFYLVTVLAVIVIMLYMKATPVEHRLARFALALILSGAIGNFIDRVRLGYVIDWIDVRWHILGWRYDFPNFNIADSAITVGVSMLMVDMLVLETVRKKKSKGRASTADSMGAANA